MGVGRGRHIARDQTMKTGEWMGLLGSGVAVFWAAGSNRGVVVRSFVLGLDSSIRVG